MLLTRFFGRSRPFFRAQFLGDKHPAIDFLVELLGVTTPLVPYFFVQADFTRPLDVPPLDGIVAANSLHYVRDKTALLRRLRGYLKPTGRLLVVEYNADQGNPWVPHPFSFATFGSLAQAAGYREPTLIATYPSRFLREIYSAWTMSS
jgi:SAM-dependent methyltransferase